VLQAEEALVNIPPGFVTKAEKWLMFAVNPKNSKSLSKS